MIDQDYKKVGFFVMESHSKDQAMCDRTLLVHKKVLTCKNKVFIFYTFFLLDLDQIKTKKKKQNEMLQQGKCLFVPLGSTSLCPSFLNFYYYTHFV